MLFNSVGFLFLFLPGLLAAFYLLAATPLRFLCRPLLIVATLVFYSLGGWDYLPLLLASTVFNFSAGFAVGRTAGRPGLQKLVLAGAVVLNLLLLGYFKYFNFLLYSLNAAFGPTFEIEAIILPLGISFFTFQQIGYLVDVARGRMEPGKPLDYANFVLFFPQLLAGPIVLFKETVPQFQKLPLTGAAGRNILIGLAIFAIGLFKKTVIADTAALYASPVFLAARTGEAIGMFDTWVAAFAYTAQIYFDFSGYSDMAIGTARMFGIILPLNFHSPLRSATVVEVWRRWHITLGRWVQAYIFQPITVPLTRMAAMRGYGRWGTLWLGIVIPTMISMLIIGVWHGGAWTFVIFGLMQGIYMSVNELWAEYRRKARKARKKQGEAPYAWHRPLATAATLTAFVLSIIPFGSPNVEAMTHMFSAMAGLGPAFVQPADWPLGTAAAIIILALTYAAIFFVPNSQQIMARFEPVLEAKKWLKGDAGPLAVEWKMTAGWALLTGLVLFLGVAFIMRGTTQFIYLDF